MKRLKTSLAIIGLALVHGQAGSTPLDDRLVNEDWPCAVKMCKQNPKGELDEPKCRPPIKKMYDELAKGHPIPRCQNGSDDNTEKEVYDYYDPCPSGTEPVRQGEIVMSGTRNSFGAIVPNSKPKTSEVVTMNGAFPTDRACVYNPLGYVSVSGNDEGGVVAGVYGNVVWQKAQPPRAIDVYTRDGKFVRRERY